MGPQVHFGPPGKGTVLLKFGFVLSHRAFALVEALECFSSSLTRVLGDEPLSKLVLEFGPSTVIGFLSRASPAPSHTQAITRTSPAVPALTPSYSQVTRWGIRARDPGKQHVIGTRDQPRDLQVLWGSRDPRARDPVKKTGDLPRDWSAT